MAGTAIFLTSNSAIAPSALLHSLKHYKVLHEKSGLPDGESRLTFQDVIEAERIRMERVDDRFSRVFMTFGYMEEPNVPGALVLCRKQGWKFDIMSTSFFVSRRTIKPSAQRRDACLAGQALHRPPAKRQRCDGVFPDSDGSGCGDRRSVDGLIFSGHVI